MTELSNQSQPLTTLQILREALKLITKNYNLILPILLLNLLTSTLLFYLNHHTLTSIFSNIFTASLAIAFAASPEISQLTQLFSTIRKDIREIILVEAAFLVTSFIIQSLLSLAVIHLLSVVHSRGLPTLKDLFSKLKRAWKGPIVTMLYISFFTAGYASLVLVPIHTYLLLSYYDSFLWTAFGGIVALLPLSLFVYLATVWSVSVVVSVVDEDCYGLSAIVKATEIVEGRRLQGVLILLIELAVQVVPSVAFGRAMLSIHNPMTVLLAVGVVHVVLLVVVHVFMLAATTVYYHECKKSQVAMDGGFAYSALTPVAILDEALA